MLLRDATETIELRRVNGNCRVVILRKPFPPYTDLLESVLLIIVVCGRSAHVRSLPRGSLAPMVASNA
jgi:hypothetical protein